VPDVSQRSKWILSATSLKRPEMCCSRVTQRRGGMYVMFAIERLVTDQSRSATRRKVETDDVSSWKLLR